MSRLSSLCLLIMLCGGCVHHNDYFRQYTLRGARDVAALDAYVRNNPALNAKLTSFAEHGTLRVGMPEDLVKAICGDKLERSAGLNSWILGGEYPARGWYDDRKLYLYFDEGKLAAIILIGWREGDPL